MNKQQRLLIKLLDCSIKRISPSPEDFCDADWNFITTEAKEHSIYQLLYSTVKSLPLKDGLTEEVIEKWKQSTLKSALYFRNLRYHMDKIFLEFNTANIPVIALKGFILKDFYPIPDLRVMGDVDILVHIEDLDRTSNLLIDLGYVKSKHSTPAHVIFCHKDFSHIEVHWTLSDSRYLQDDSTFEKELWSKVLNENTGEAEVLRLGTDDFLIHMIIHMAVHMKSGGFGLRQLCDLFLFMEKEGHAVNWYNVTSTLETNNLLKFTSAIFQVCNELFKLTIPPCLSAIEVSSSYVNLLIEDIFDSGVHGMKSIDRVFGNNLLNSQVTFDTSSDSNMNSVWSLIFPPISSLSSDYDYAKKYKILSPIAWIHHLISGLANKQYSLLDKLKFFFFSTSTFKKRDKLIKHLEL